MSTSTTIKSLLAGVAASGVVIGLGTIGIQYATDAQTSEKVSNAITLVTSPLIIQHTYFTPESVSIIMESSNPDYPVTCNPIYAQIVLSEGFPVDWVIADEAGDIVSYGTQLIVDRTIFGALVPGDYRLDWTISSDAGETGVASRSFTIIG
jgi:hypothetical protein